MYIVVIQAGYCDIWDLVWKALQLYWNTWWCLTFSGYWNGFFFQPDLVYLLYIWVTKMLLGGRQGYCVPPLSYVRRMGSLSVMLPLSLYIPTTSAPSRQLISQALMLSIKTGYGDRLSQSGTWFRRGRRVCWLGRKAAWKSWRNIFSCRELNIYTHMRLMVLLSYHVTVA